MRTGPGGELNAREAGWRQVLAVAVLIVVGVLALQLLSTFVPQIGQLLSGFPTVIVVLVIVTIAVVVLAVRSQGR